MAIGVLTSHWAKEGLFDQARQLLDGNGLAQSKAQGFISREPLYSLTDSAKIPPPALWARHGS